MPHSKTPGGQQPSEKYLKQQTESHGTGAASHPDHKELPRPGDAPVAGDSYTSTSGIDNDATNVPGETGKHIGTIVGEKPGVGEGQGRMK